MLSKENEYLKTAYETLEEISADQQKRLEYTARQKALYDYNTLMEESYNRGRTERDSELLVKMRAEGIGEDVIKRVLGGV